MIRKDGDVKPTAEPAPPPPPVVEAVEVPAASPEDKSHDVSKAAGVVAQLLVAAVLLALAGLATWTIISRKTAPAELPASTLAPVVRVVQAEIGTYQPTIIGYGRVRASREVDVAPQVGGRVVNIHPDLVTGGTIAGGATVIEIDKTDYELALTQRRADLRRAEAAVTRVAARERAARAEVARRETALETMQAEAAVARDEYRRLNPDRAVPPLVAKEPQLRENEAALEAARASLDDVAAEELELQAGVEQARAAVARAEADLARTTLVAPGDASTRYRVANESVEVGQNVGVGQVLARLYEADSLEVPVPLDDQDLRFLDVPGASATVRLDNVDALPGRAVRTSGEIDPLTQLVEVIVAIDANAAGLVPGRFVRVDIEGQPVGDVAVLPRRTVNVDEAGDDSVFLVRSGRLERQAVEVVRKTNETISVRGLDADAGVLLTRLQLATDGMEVRVAEDD
jgi:RND family efflux transporter MFP subunit